MEVPDTKIAEIVDGELVVSPRPASPHAHSAVAIGIDVAGRFHGPPGRSSRRGGWWLLMEPELHFGDDVLVPDWAGWRYEHMPILPSVPFFTQQPDWVCEIVSRSTGRLDRSRKMRIYARERIAHLWRVDPLAQTVEVYRFEQGHWLVEATHGGEDVVRIDPFAAVEIALGEWWLPSAAGT